jgi:hypothetical protein
MKKMIFLASALFYLCSCQHTEKSHSNQDIQIINDVFPGIVDTVALSFYFSCLELVPKTKLQWLKAGKIDNRFDSLHKGEKFVVRLDSVLRITWLKKEQLKSFLTGLSIVRDKEFNAVLLNARSKVKISANMITNAGRYTVTGLNAAIPANGRNYVGEVTFSRIYVDNQNGLAFLTAEILASCSIWHMSQYYLNYMFVLHRMGDKWHIAKSVFVANGK